MATAYNAHGSIHAEIYRLKWAAKAQITEVILRLIENSAQMGLAVGVVSLNNL